jgi:hypothetical protein
MSFRTNYRSERIERHRLKKAKKDEKQRREQERKAERAATANVGGSLADDGHDGPRHDEPNDAGPR